MTITESNENLIADCEANSSTSGSTQNIAIVHERSCSLAPVPEKSLTREEKTFILLVERGDCASVRRHIEQFKGQNEVFDIDCVDPLNRSALIIAIENENIELLHILLDSGVQVKDALLHAISEEYVEAVEILLEFEERTHKAGTPYSWEAVDRAQSTFTADITPLVMAAHKNNYEILKILLDRGATLPTPHDVRCGCDDCVVSSDRDSLRHSQSRINAYRALSSPSLIALSSRDPLLTSFELSWELRRLSRMENEFREEYNEMREHVQVFATSLLDHARSSTELETILNHDPDGENWNAGDKNTLERLKLAINYKQKQFVAHANVQQLLARMWYDGLPGFRRKGPVAQLLAVGQMAASFPINSTICLLAPKSEKAKLMNKPFVKFINHSASYAFFLTLLGAASQRVEFLVMEWFGNAWMQEVLADWMRRERGALPGLVESAVIIYVFSLICWELRSLWSEGLMEYITDMWNIIDFVCNMFYINWIALRFTAIFITWREYWNGWDPYYPREHWHPFDPMLLSEGMFAAGMIMSFLKLVHIFSVNPHLGPLQISLGRMIIDIIKFFFIYTLVLFAFGCGMNQLMWYYADLEQKKCYHLPGGLPDFDNQEMACTIWRRFSNMFETSQSLFWASFGLVDLMAFELKGIKSFTRFWALLMFGSYSVINVIVLLNMLIAMMSNSYQIISERSDVEWKFARSKLWISYFDEGDVVPPPFNLVPGVNLVMDMFSKRPSGSVKARSREKALERHDTVAKLLVRRFVTAEQRKRDDFGITEDDVMEIRQDISTLRYEIVDILRTNGMKTPKLDKDENTLAGKKGKVLERRLLQDFKIGCIEGIINDEIGSEKESKDIFSKIARAIGKRKSTVKVNTGASTKKDWNAIAQRKNSRRDPIGNVLERERRRSSQRGTRAYIEGTDARDPEKLLEYNPYLKDMTPTARVAYAKFKTRKLKREKEFHDKLNEEPEEDDVFESGNKKPEKPQANGVCSIKVQDTGPKTATKETTLVVTSASPVAPPRNTTSIKNTQDSTKLSGIKEERPETKPGQGQRRASSPRRSPSPRPATPPPSDLSPRNSVAEGRRRSRSPTPTSRTGTVLPSCIEEKPVKDKSKPGSVKAATALLGSVKNKPAPPTPGASKPSPSKPADASAKPTPAKPAEPPAKIQYTSELEPGKGKSKLSGQMLQGWI